MENDIDFKRAIRGYDPADVERVLDEMHHRLDVYANERAATSRQVKQLTEELAEAREQGSKERPTFRDLGTAFEGTLRIAEEQSAKIFADAKAESLRVLSEAQAASLKMREEATMASEAMHLDSQRRSDEAQLTNDQLVARNRRSSVKQLQKADQTLADAESRAATVRAEAELEIALSKGAANEEVARTKREASEMVFAAEQALASSETLIRQRLEDGERARAETQKRADVYATAVIENANARYEEVSNHAAALAAEYEALIAGARQRDEAEMKATRAYSDRLVAQTIARGHTVAQDTEEILRVLTQDAENQVTDLRRQQNMLREYMGRLKFISDQDTEPVKPVVYLTRSSALGSVNRVLEPLDNLA